MVATRRAQQRHPARMYRWTSEEAAHAFFQEQRLRACFATAVSTCEPFLLPPDTEIRSPRLHPGPLKQPTLEPQALLREPARGSQRSTPTARHSLTAAQTPLYRDSARKPQRKLRLSCTQVRFRWCVYAQPPGCFSCRPSRSGSAGEASRRRPGAATSASYPPASG